MKVLIVGGGIAGLTLAFWLDRVGHQPIVVERSPRLRDAGYMVDFFGPGFDVAERMGLLPALEKIHYPIARLAFVDGHGHEKFSIAYAALRKLFDNRHFNFMRGDLEQVLYDQIKDRVDVRFGTTVTSFEQDCEGVEATLSDGSRETCELLVGADGVHSAIRRQAFGDEDRFLRFLGYDTAAFILDDVAGLDVPRDAFSTLTVAHRQVAVYPIRDGRLATFFVHETSRTLGTLSREQIDAELRRVYSDLDWVVPELLQRSRKIPNLYFDAVTQVELPRWSEGWVTLVGDACQCVSLMAGQGASMAMIGAYVLADELKAVETADDVTAALARYEEREKPVAEEKQKSGRDFAQ